MQIKKEQLEFMNWEFGVFFHFGIRTFYEGHSDWDMKEMSLEGFCPQHLSCENWINTISKAGAKYAILVCKHHDGFANWPSKYTKYSVANTPWKDGKGDLVKDFTDACRKYNIKVGLYYSPAQFGSAKCNADEYDDYFINQISELLTNYGKIDYLWFDGCGSENHQYDTIRIVNVIRKLQPNILIFNMWDPDTRWVHNESGLVPMPNNNIVSDLSISVRTESKEKLSNARFLPGECDCRMRLSNWFYSDSDVDTVKSVDELIGLYQYSVGRGANLLINIGPNRDGLLPEPDATNLIEFGEKIKSMYSNPINTDDNVTFDKKICSITFKEHSLINQIVIEECMETGEHIEAFDVYIYPYSYGNPILVYQGTTVGHKHICIFPTVRTQKVDIKIVKQNDEYKIKNIKAYKI